MHDKLFKSSQGPLLPVDPDQFHVWMKNPVTKHLFKDLENAFLDSVLDPLPTKSLDALTITAIARQGRREFIDFILEWKPEGCDETHSDEWS